MLTLMRKDLQVVAGFGWLIAWLVAPSYLVPVLTASRTGGAIFWVNVAFATASLVSVCLLDARSGADRFVHSLPVTRTDVVAAVMALLVAAGSTWLASRGYFWSDDWVLMTQVANEGLTPARLLTPHGGHLQPASYLIIAALRALGGPLPWAASVALGGVLLVVALLLTWWLVRVLVGPRPAALVPFGAVAMSGLSYTVSSWPASTATTSRPR